MVRGRKRAPRLPGHLLCNDSFTTAPGSPEHVSERPYSPTSSVETSSILDMDDRVSDVSQLNTKPGITRMTHSPLMHSAIVQGAAPKARVKNTSVGALAPTIKSVLGFGGPGAAAHQHQHSNLRASRSRSCVSGAMAGMASLSIPEVLPIHTTEDVHCCMAPRPHIAHFDKGDLVWYHHPSGPWIPGSFESRLRNLTVPYAIRTDRDGVGRFARPGEIVLRTSETPPLPTAGAPAVRDCADFQRPSKQQSAVSASHAALRSRGHDRRSDRQCQAETSSQAPADHHGIQLQELQSEPTHDSPEQGAKNTIHAADDTLSGEQLASVEVSSAIDGSVAAKNDKAVGVGLCITDLNLH